MRHDTNRRTTKGPMNTQKSLFKLFLTGFFTFAMTVTADAQIRHDELSNLPTTVYKRSPYSADVVTLVPVKLGVKVIRSTGPDDNIAIKLVQILTEQLSNAGSRIGPYPYTGYNNYDDGGVAYLVTTGKAGRPRKQDIQKMLNEVADIIVRPAEQYNLTEYTFMPVKKKRSWDNGNSPF